jgi:hypothetical protein
MVLDRSANYPFKEAVKIDDQGGLFMRHAQRLYWSSAAIGSSVWEEERELFIMRKTSTTRLACAASPSIEGKLMVASGRTAATSPFFPSSDGMRSCWS